MFNVKVGEIEGASVKNGTAKVGLSVRGPGNASLFQQPDQVVMCVELRLSGLRVCEDAEVRTSLEPQIVGLARMVARRIEVPLCVRLGLEQLSIDVRGEWAVFGVGITERGARIVACPVVIFHQNDPNSSYFAHLGIADCWHCTKQGKQSQAGR